MSRNSSRPSVRRAICPTASTRLFGTSSWSSGMEFRLSRQSRDPLPPFVCQVFIFFPPSFCLNPILLAAPPLIRAPVVTISRRHFSVAVIESPQHAPHIPPAPYPPRLLFLRCTPAQHHLHPHRRHGL